MLDRQGRVTSRFFEDYYWERNTVSNILLRTGAAADAGPGDAGVNRAPGAARLSQRREPSPRARGFRWRSTSRRSAACTSTRPARPAIGSSRLNITPQPHVRVMPTAVPAVGDLPLRAAERACAGLPEAVHAADGGRARKPRPRRGRRSAGKNELSITGTLDYQACDDKICYNPVSLPLSWKVALTANVPGAPPSPGR